jgi:hypothetical protein
MKLSTAVKMLTPQERSPPASGGEYPKMLYTSNRESPEATLLVTSTEEEFEAKEAGWLDHPSLQEIK